MNSFKIDEFVEYKGVLCRIEAYGENYAILELKSLHSSYIGPIGKLFFASTDNVRYASPIKLAKYRVQNERM